MLIPPMCEVKTFAQIVAELVAIHQIRIPTYVPNESDETMPILETFAYREMLLRNHFNAQIAGSFWQTATGDDLDFVASFFGVFRSKGSKPTATVKFTLNTVLTYDYILDAGLEIVNSDGSMSLLLSAVTIPLGSLTANGIAELQAYVSTSDATITATLNPKPYLGSIESITAYAGGSDQESDESVRERISLSFEDQTTAGSANSYKLHALKSDARIDEINVFSSTAGTVDVIVHSLSGVDATMISRVIAATSGETVRPLTDTVLVRAASVINYSVNAVLKISESSDTATTLNEANVRLAQRLAAVKIGDNVTVGAIISALSVDGVLDVTLSDPVATVVVTREQVAVPTALVVSVA